MQWHDERYVQVDHTMDSVVYKQTTAMDAAFKSVQANRSHPNHPYIESLAACPPQQKIDHGACFGKPTSCLLATASSASHSPSHIEIQRASSKRTKEENTDGTVFCGSIPANPAPPLREYRSSLFSEASLSSSKSVISVPSSPVTSVQSINPFESREFVELSHWDTAATRNSAESKVRIDVSTSARKLPYFRISKIKGLLAEKAKQGIASVQGSPDSCTAFTHSEELYTRSQGGKADSITSSAETLQFTRSTQCTVEQKKLVAREATTKTITIPSSCPQSIPLKAIPTPPITRPSSDGETSSPIDPATLYPLLCSTTSDRKEPANATFSGYVADYKNPAEPTETRLKRFQPPADEDTDSSEEEMDSIISGLLRISAIKKPADSNASIHSSTTSSDDVKYRSPSQIEDEEHHVEPVEMAHQDELQLADDDDFNDRRSSIGSLVVIDEQDELVEHHLPIWPAMSSTIKSPFSTTETTTLPKCSGSMRSPIQERKQIVKAGNRPLRVV
ncbi:uncharacterized protein MELLADRAFT_110342 [Melampsora larici-populina 98AG31]|uniref:Uncharacterized protein n=1 Tax=Melampsora larici-populina (strain 98AG31 / pathotype 3-4-7) TaxID=747676 RepID=F4RZG1_MELLP|nr:uncharacterized protein MELLADRAFT_110342 [Melampsora larici-populina 98AG31]EGG02220.1 hypothetical protein MELLADRAFT_110342 [Melampsora larici-populina 98AG31]